MTFSARIEPLYVVDTNALIWYLTHDKKLGRQAALVFSAAERGETQLMFSAITVAELYYANQKHKFFDDFATHYGKLRDNPQYQFYDFTSDDVLEFASTAAVTEMHDRIIVGLARRLQAPLLTSDSIIIAAQVVKIVW